MQETGHGSARVFDGFLERYDGAFVAGWAVNTARPDEPVEVEIELSSGWTTTVKADLFREDLAKKRQSHGRHGFLCRLPASARGYRDAFAGARVKGTPYILNGCPQEVRPAPLIKVIAGDIVNNCNLRCPFCIVDYEKVRGLQLMPRETFDRALAMLPLVRDGQFWLSCMHEPTLHPEFADLVESVPLHLRQKISFTSNFCKKLSDDLLSRLARSGIHTVRVSFDSARPELFAQYRKGGRFEVFSDNLRRFAEFRRASPNPPRLQFISMAFKENLDEIPELVRRGKEEFNATLHEIRFMYYAPHIADWGVDRMMSLEQWQSLKSQVQAAPHGQELDWSDPAPEVFDQFREKRGVAEYEHPPAVFGGFATVENYQKADPLCTGTVLPNEDWVVRMRWDGLLMVEHTPEDAFRVNVVHLPDPTAYFRDLRASTLPGDKESPAVWTRVPLRWETATRFPTLEDKLEEAKTETRDARADAETFAQWLYAAETERDALKARIRRWRESASWPLARMVLPASPPRPAPAEPIRPGEFTYYFHTNLFQVFRARKVTLRGWTYPKEDRRVLAIRARVDDQVFPGVCGLEEPEVLRVHGRRPRNPNPGFEVSIELSPGRQTLVVEAEVEGTGWLAFLHTGVWAVFEKPEVGRATSSSI